jgi:hypothetical protein
VRLWGRPVRLSPYTPASMPEGRPTTPNPDHLSPELLTRLQPGLARLMPEIANRLWRAAHAGRAGNWRLARWQVSEMAKLFELCTITRPKYADDIAEFLHDEVEPLRAAITAEDSAAFASRLADAVDAANDYHRRWDKDFIVWRLPEDAPPDLDLTAYPPGR